MRILGNIDHPTLKITVFKTEMRLLVKLEDAQYEQTFKFRETDELKSLDDVQKILDEPFMNAIFAQFNVMSQAVGDLYARHFNIQEEDFPVII